MKIITIPGSSIPTAAIRHYGIEISAGKMVVDGIEHELKDGLRLSQVDNWIDSAKKYPQILGTSAAEFVDLFMALAKTDQELLVIAPTNKIIPTYTAALSAQKILQQNRSYQELKIKIIDSGVTDGGLGLMTILAAEARNAGLPFEEIAKMCEALPGQIHSIVALDSLEYMAKGGRASFLKTRFVSWMKIKPLVGFVDGRLQPLAKVRREKNVLAKTFEIVFERVPKGTKIWAAVTHGRVHGRATSLIKELGKHYDIHFSYLGEVAPAIYLNSGPGTIALYFFRVDKLQWIPTLPNYSLLGR